MKNRIDRVNELIKKKIAEIILREIFVENALITVQSVDVSKDLKYARIKVSVFPFKESEKALKIIKKQLPNLQKILNRVIKIKFVPKIRFVLDKTEEKAYRVEKILRNLKN